MSDPKILQNNRTCATCGSPDLSLVEVMEKTTAGVLAFFRDLVSSTRMAR
jgi:hypothetical protein